MFLLYPHPRMWPYSRSKETSPSPNRGQTGQTLRRCGLDQRTLEVERREIRMGHWSLGQAQTGQEMGYRPLGEKTPGMGMG